MVSPGSTSASSRPARRSAPWRTSAPQNPPRTEIHRGEAIVKLRPDLAVAAVHAPPQTLSTRPIDVVADISELNGDVARRRR